MLEGLLGALTIQTNKPSYGVGEEAAFRIEGGFPNAMIAWTSFKDGVSTGEYQSAYPGQFLDASGNLTLPMGAPWNESQVGLWQKQVIAINPDNPQDVQTAQVFFTVGSADAATNGAPGASFWDMQMFGIPVWGLLAAGGVGLYLFTRK